MTTGYLEEERDQEEALLQTDVEPIPQDILKKYILFSKSRVSWNTTAEHNSCHTIEMNLDKSKTWNGKRKSVKNVFWFETRIYGNWIHPNYSQTHWICY